MNYIFQVLIATAEDSQEFYDFQAIFQDAVVNPAWVVGVLFITA